MRYALDLAMVSIVIPAYNEAKTIEHCLRSLLQDAEPGEFEVVVVANGCTDDTARRARALEHPDVQVIETAVGSKTHALNLGDDACTRFPRVYLDADIQLGAPAVRQVAQLLERDLVLAAPRAVVDYADRNRWVRAYYHVWTRLPYFTEGMIGSGVYAFSQAGRSRFDRFPDIIADDEFARLQAQPDERGSAEDATFVITPPTSLRGVLKIITRARAGNYQLRERFPHLARNNNTNAARTLSILARRPELWTRAPVYLGVMLAAKLRAHRKLKRDHARTWDRDDSAREALGQQATGS